MQGVKVQRAQCFCSIVKRKGATKQHAKRRLLFLAMEHILYHIARAV